MRKGQTNMDKDVILLLDTLIEAMEESRIYAGACYEKLCKNKDYVSAELLCMTRDTLNAQIKILKDFQTIRP